MNKTFTIDHIQSALDAHSPNEQPSLDSERNAAVAIVLSEAPKGELAALFMQRAEHPLDPWSGQMSFPGGGVEDHDKTLKYASMRETLEEVGLPLDDTHYMGRLHDQFAGRLKTHLLAVSPFVFYHPDPPPLVHNEEVADTVWVPLSYMVNPKNSVLFNTPLDPEGRAFPSFQYQHYTIWGLTYRMLRDFFALLDMELPMDPELKKGN
jgi:8-oxo-dGTP pyrophosphatase MutT (NUDIX family)